ncbi:MAG TPA: translation initiation factor IF-2 [Candidatus Thermoplasmatota archaeon]|nr:translation initiation factor IF-2 [Candidatus Thermoplasmatota archaeon]
MSIRQPIVSVLGHVDHGKTSLLDKIRGSTVASREAGAITQHIGASEMPLDAIKEVCGPLMKGRDFKVPGLLFIDTPGHQAFSSLRARGGALADIAILVVDLNEGFRPQTKEALSILRRNKTPFVVAANKVDLVHGWESEPLRPFMLGIKEQPERVQGKVDEKCWEVIGGLTENGVPSADRIDRIRDFTTSVAVVPVSAKTGEGIPDLLLTLVGLAQRFLEKKLETDLGVTGRGTVLEVKQETGLGLTLNAIIYDGNIRQGDTIVLGTTGEPKVTKVKGLLRPKPKDEMRDHREPFTSTKEITAAAGIKIVAQDLEGVLSGAPLVVVRDEEQAKLVIDQVRDEARVSIELADEGVFVKADTLGSLEALAFELKQRNIPIKRAEVGNISKRDLVDVKAVKKPTFRAILAFSVKTLPDAQEALASSKDFEDIKVLTSDIIYHLLDEYEEWTKVKQQDVEKNLRETMTFPGKVTIMPDHVFRTHKPAIVGMRILAGRLRVDQKFLLTDGRVLGQVRSIRRGEESVKEALPGEEVAVAIDEVTIGRQMDAGGIYYVDMPEGDAKKFLRTLIPLNYDELEVVKEIQKIKAKENRFWGA